MLVHCSELSIDTSTSSAYAPRAFEDAFENIFPRLDVVVDDRIKAETPLTPSSASSSSADSVEQAMLAAGLVDGADPIVETSSMMSMSFTPTARPRVRARTQNRRKAYGNESYKQLCVRAIRASPHGRLTLHQIYQWMCSYVPHLRGQSDVKSVVGWKNSVRHNLSLHACFIKKANEDPRSSTWWMYDPTATGIKPRRQPHRPIAHTASTSSTPPTLLAVVAQLEADRHSATAVALTPCIKSKKSSTTPPMPDMTPSSYHALTPIAYHFTTPSYSNPSHYSALAHMMETPAGMSHSVPTMPTAYSPPAYMTPPLTYNAMPSSSEWPSTMLSMPPMTTLATIPQVASTPPPSYYGGYYAMQAYEQYLQTYCRY